MTISTIGLSDIEIEQRSFITKVYGWMCFALIVTGAVAFGTYSTPAVLKIILGNPLVFYGLVIAELLLVGVLAGLVQKMSATIATLIFIGYAALNGLTFSIIFLAYTHSSIATTFFITAGTFGIISLYGYVTKTDLTTVGNLCFMALIGMILASFVNIFLHNGMIYWITTYIGILIFVGLTAYDTQKIKMMNIIGNEGTEEDRKEAIMGALTLYLDFINLFLLLLRVMGGRRRD